MFGAVQGFSIGKSLFGSIGISIQDSLLKSLYPRVSLMAPLMHPIALNKQTFPSLPNLNKKESES